MATLRERMAQDGSAVHMIPFDRLTKAQKDEARRDPGVGIFKEQGGPRHIAIINGPLNPEEPVELEPDDDGPVIPPNTPSIPEDLEVLTVAQLKELADQEGVDISGLKIRADILGRIWAIREQRADEQEG